MKYTDVEFRELSEYIENNDFDRYLNGKTILITGSKGLVGTSLVKWILLQNKIKNCNTHIIASTRNPEDVPGYIENCDSIEYCEYEYSELYEDTGVLL